MRTAVSTALKPMLWLKNTLVFFSSLLSLAALSERIKVVRPWVQSSEACLSPDAGGGGGLMQWST